MKLGLGLGVLVIELGLIAVGSLPTWATGAPGIAFGDSPVSCDLATNNPASSYLSVKIEFLNPVGHEEIPAQGAITALAWITGIPRDPAATGGTAGQSEEMGAFLGTLTRDGFVSNSASMRLNISFSSKDGKALVKLEGKDEHAVWQDFAFPTGFCVFEQQGSIGSHNRGR